MPSTYQLLVGNNTGLYNSHAIHTKIIKGVYYMNDDDASQCTVLLQNLPPAHILDEQSLLKLLKSLGTIQVWHYLEQYNIAMVLYASKDEANSAAMTLDNGIYDQFTISATVYYNYVQDIETHNDGLTTFRKLMHGSENAQDNNNSHSNSNTDRDVYSLPIFHQLVGELETSIHVDDRVEVFDLPPVRKKR